MASPQKENGYTAIANEIMEALAKIRISGEARQMLDVIIRKTYGYNKKHDQIATSQLKKFTGLSNMAIHKARQKLIDMNIITVTKKGNSQIITYSIQKDYHKWKPLPKKVIDVTVTKKGNGVLPKKVTTVTKKGNRTVTKKVIHKRQLQKTIYKRQYTKDNSKGSKEPCFTNEAFDYFCLKYKDFRNKDYIASFAKDKKILKDLLSVIPIEDLKKLMDMFFATPDKFCEQAGYTIGVFKAKINSLQTGNLTLKVSDKTLKSMLAAQEWIKEKEVVDVEDE